MATHRKVLIFPIFTNNSNYFLLLCVLAILVAGGTFLKHQGDHQGIFLAENSTDRRAWQATVHGVANSQV